MNPEVFKEKLLSQKEKLEKQTSYLQKEDPYRKDDRSSEILDDAITEIEGHDRLSATYDELRKDLHEINLALLRIEAGTYGICVSCGNKIEVERLEIMPTATKCLSCQRKLKK